MLATSLTPASYRVTELFLESNRPTKKSDVWNAPAAARSFHITYDDAGQPVLVIGAAENAVYRVQRDAAGESFILTELYGSAGETLYYTDTKARAGVTYTYRVIPVHAELLENGVLLEGMQSVQVARVKEPTLGSTLKNWWNKVFSDDDEDRPESVFSE